MHGMIAVFAGLVLLTITAVSPNSIVRQSDGCCEEYCYGTDTVRPQSKQFSSKTAYQQVNGNLSLRPVPSKRIHLKILKLFQQILWFKISDCTPSKFWLLSRHGTRNPSANTIRQIRELTQIRNEILLNYGDRNTQPATGKLCDEDLELLRNWHLDANVTEDKSNALVEQGWDDLRQLAIRYQLAFPNLLENIYSSQKFQFKYTDSDRTNDSLKGFLEGLFGDQAYNHISTPVPTEEDLLLKVSVLMNLFLLVL